jgi:hypothetical protein
MQASTIRICGGAVLAGAVTWAVCWLVAPSNPDVNTRIEIVGYLVFQLGLLAMLLAMYGTAATGGGRWGRAVLAVEAVLLLLTIAWTIPHVISPNMPDRGIMTVLDAMAPPSFVWLIPLGVTVVRVRRWPSPARFAPLVAGFWFPAVLAALVAAGETGFTVVNTAWLIVGFGWVGLALIRDVASTAGTPFTAAAEPTTAT